MPYLALGIFAGTAVLVAASYLRFRDPLFPAVIHPAIWGAVLFLYCLNTDSFLPLAPQTLFIFLSGIAIFALGCYVATWNFTRCGNACRVIPRTRLLALLLWGTALLLPVAFLQAFRVASGGPTSSFLVNLRLVETSGEGGRFIWNYLVILGVISASLHLLAINSESKPSGRWHFLVSIIIALGYCILNTGRTWLFLFLIVLLALSVLTGRIAFKKAVLYALGVGLLIFAIVSIALGKAGNVNSGMGENLSSLWSAFRLYLLGPLPCFDSFVRHHQTLRWGDNVFRSFWAATDKLGFDTPPVSLVHEFINIPFPMNVYTVYRPYFDDFGTMGAIILQFPLGLLHGMLYRKAFGGKPFFTCVFAFSLYPLAMQFFEDQYLTLSTQWILTFGILAFYFYWTKLAAQAGRSGLANESPIPANV